jgi:hypothetical protein
MEEKLIARITSYRNESPQTITIQKESEAHFSGKSIARLTPICGDEYDRYHYPLDKVWHYTKLMLKAEEMYDILMSMAISGKLDSHSEVEFAEIIEYIENGKLR